MTVEEKLDIVEQVKSGYIDHFYKRRHLLYEKMLSKKCKDSKLVEEIINDSFVRALQKKSQFTGNTYGELNNWMQKIVHTVYLNTIQRNNKHMVSGKMVFKKDLLLQANIKNDDAYLDFFNWISPIENNNYDFTIDSDNFLQELQKLLSKKDYKIIFMFAQGYRQAELAKKFKMSEETIQNKIYEIRKLIRKTYSNTLKNL